MSTPNPWSLTEQDEEAALMLKALYPYEGISWKLRALLKDQLADFELELDSAQASEMVKKSNGLFNKDLAEKSACGLSRMPVKAMLARLKGMAKQERNLYESIFPQSKSDSVSTTQADDNVEAKTTEEPQTKAESESFQEEPSTSAQEPSSSVEPFTAVPTNEPNVTPAKEEQEQPDLTKTPSKHKTTVKASAPKRRKLDIILGIEPPPINDHETEQQNIASNSVESISHIPLKTEMSPHLYALLESSKKKEIQSGSDNFSGGEGIFSPPNSGLQELLKSCAK